jgi:hypothetical protein
MMTFGLSHGTSLSHAPHGRERSAPDGFGQKAGFNLSVRKNEVSLAFRLPIE